MFRGPLVHPSKIPARADRLRSELAVAREEMESGLLAQNEPLVHFRNQPAGIHGHCVTFQLEGTRSNREWCRCGRDGNGWRSQPDRDAVRGRELPSAGDALLHFGLGPCDRVDSFEVRWPSGRVDRHLSLRADRG